MNSCTVIIADALGYITLANLLGNALLRSSYLALILYALVEVLDGFVMIVLSARPFALLRVIIMPNGKLISERVTNWTLSSRRHGIELPVAVEQGNDPGRVIGLLERTAAEHSMIAGDPPPQALVVKLGADVVDFELRAAKIPTYCLARSSAEHTSKFSLFAIPVSSMFPIVDVP